MTDRGPDVDPIDLQLVANALASTSDEMATTLFRTAHSTVVRDAMDFSAALTDPVGQTIAQAVSVPFHLGSIPVAMETLLDRYGDEMAPGDVFIMNDPFDGGIHLPDIFIAVPIFAGDRLLGFSVSTAHHGDVGGRVPGSCACDNTEIFQEGLRLPWMRFHREGQRVRDIERIIVANVRIPDVTLGDIEAQISACTVGERGLRSLSARYGPERLATITDAIIEHTERLVRAEIAEWPDGSASFTDHLDSDGIEIRPVQISCSVEVHGDEVTADFSASSPMVRGALNSTRSFIEAAVYQAVRCAITAEIPNTAGMFRPIHVITKPGTITHVEMPGASSMRGVTGFRAFDAVSGALAQIVPDRVPAAGEGGNTLAILSGEHGERGRYIYFELVCGTWGGTPQGDGNDGISNPSSTAANIPVEVAENEFPLVIERYGLVPDSGGPGLHRGGLAIERAWRVLHDDVNLTVRSDRHHHPPYGLHGGEHGAASENTIRRADGAVEPADPMFGTVLAAGDTYVHRTAGGGGWGPALTRDPCEVADDVRNGKVTRESARTRYGVVLAPGGAVDEHATAEERDRLTRRSSPGEARAP